MGWIKVMSGTSIKVFWGFTGLAYISIRNLERIKGLGINM